jgi:FkbM family methyltransferase
MRILRRAEYATKRALRELAALPLRALSSEEQSKVVEHFLDSIIESIEVENCTLRFMASTPILQWRARTALSKEPDTIRWINQFNPDDVFWDIGANVGVFSLYAAMMRATRVFAFEPSADNYMALCRNVEINSLQERIVPYCVAFARTTTLGVLNSNSRAIGAALHQFGQPGDSSRYWPLRKGTCAQGMVGFSIDDFIGKFNPTFPTHLKLDVDGLEMDILDGAQETLCDPRVRSVMVELSVDDAGEYDAGMALLGRAGFKLTHRGEIQESAGSKAANHFFVRP